MQQKKISMIFLPLEKKCIPKKLLLNMFSLIFKKNFKIFKIIQEKINKIFYFLMLSKFQTMKKLLKVCCYLRKIN